MIKVTRIDHRLLHGQVAFTWIKAVGADCILIANDDVASNDLRMAALRMAKPAGVKLVMKSVQDSIDALNSGVTDKYNLFIIVETIGDAHRLANGAASIREINLGGAKNADDKHRISPAVCVTDTECAQLRELADAGVHVYLQQVPSETPVDVLPLI